MIITRKSGKHLHVTYGTTAVSTLLGLINSEYYDLFLWRSNQWLQNAELKLDYWATGTHYTQAMLN